MDKLSPTPQGPKKLETTKLFLVIKWWAQRCCYRPPRPSVLCAVGQIKGTVMSRGWVRLGVRERRCRNSGLCQWPWTGPNMPLFKNATPGSSHLSQWVKDPALSLPWLGLLLRCGFNPWPWVWPKNKNKLKKKKPLLGIYLDKTFIQKDTCPKLMAALFTIAKTWKEPKCPSTDEWIKKMWYMCTMEYYSAPKKNKIMPFKATWMELETLILKWSQSEKDKHMISLICGI